ncbi:tryptophan-rich sensory protein [Pseudonocardia sp. TRM90224]|uniref:tryptophan-rich sensory protein n=1 Tax=Pseudonocardia sp. TRM90224 TaxID=2812678 RepID=UPI001E3A542C|nr:tryptophan-rich sensory protein [Pseudonocardia sp. TRM90224]
MTVTSQRPTVIDRVRSYAVIVLAIVQVAVAGLVGSGVTGASIGAVAISYPTPLLPASWAFAIWLPIYAGLLVHAIYQLLPAQRGREIHRRTGWWMVLAAVCNTVWMLAFGARSVLLAELVLIVLTVSVAVVFGRLSKEPAADRTERLFLRTPVALYAGWVSVAIVVGTAASGAAIGLPSDNAIAVVAAVVVLAAVTVIMAWVVLSGTAVVAYAIAAIWGLIGISLNEPPAAVVVTGAAAIVVVLVAIARRISAAGNPPRAAWG